MTTFNEAHVGDLIQLRRVPRLVLLVDEVWGLPLRVATEPGLCMDVGCQALVCQVFAVDGRLLPLHRRGSRVIDLLEAALGGDDPSAAAGPAVGRWSRDDEPESFDDRADYTPNDEGDNA